ncbi:hypothetical protein Z517_09264 [Fonsecaea pedrosoi CBS 271.37]|uniref:Uncharacterized protein n=1 Tax=Fonsecaea pedrosoi CBS 271.37 TaxID=1442368 RepID=A0A0D2GDR4_9EURO|nr:uncharacterized protein Z517_09264 [Fonsecaea pedrosoi CBS 271.37]KIW76820.1 hypothetical protein Z517_09264 [Fonsecaea pedrosoi CBS 271.37]
MVNAVTAHDQAHELEEDVLRRQSKAAHVQHHAPTQYSGTSMWPRPWTSTRTGPRASLRKNITIDLDEYDNPIWIIMSLNNDIVAAPGEISHHAGVRGREGGDRHGLDPRQPQESGRPRGRCTRASTSSRTPSGATCRRPADCETVYVIIWMISAEFMNLPGAADTHWLVPARGGDAAPRRGFVQQHTEVHDHRAARGLLVVLRLQEVHDDT